MALVKCCVGCYIFKLNKNTTKGNFIISTIITFWSYLFKHARIKRGKKKAFSWGPLKDIKLAY